MDAEEGSSERPGYEPEDEPSHSPWLPPDDRLWRHPSEIKDNPSPSRTAGSPGLLGQLAAQMKDRRTSVWLVGLVSGVVGALLAGGILVLTGATANSGSSAPPITGPATTSAPPSGAASPPNAISIWASVSPSIVELKVAGDQGTEIGSGVIVESAGQYAYVVTDSALFSEAGPGPVQVISDRARPGSLLGADPSAGIAVVRASMGPVHPANVGSVAELQTGADVYAAGSALAAQASGFGSYFTAGDVDDTLDYLQPVNGATIGLYSMLVANLSVDPSAYGGALVDDTGKVIGILDPASSQMGRPSVTYVTPIDTAMEELGPLVATGRPSAHPWLGILQATDAAVRSGPDGTTSGVSITSLAPGSPAARAGVVDDDLLTALNAVSTSSTGVLISFLSSARPSQVVKVAWLHDGRSHEADVTLGTQPPSANTG